MNLKYFFTIFFITAFIIPCFFTNFSSAEEMIHVGEKGYEHKSIQSAVDSAKSGDTIFVHCGLYNESVDLYKNINLVGEVGCTILTAKDDDIISINANGCTVSGFVIINCSNNDFSGINIESDNNVIENNAIEENSGWGVYIYHSSNNIIRNNTFKNDSICLIGQKSEWTSSTLQNNTVNNLPVLFYKNEKNLEISNQIAGQIILANCSYCEIINNTVSGSDQGIILGHCSNNSVEKNHASNTVMGIRLQYTENNVVRKNNVSNNDYGLYITHSNRNEIYENEIFLNKIYGCYLCCNSKNNEFHRNNFSLNDVSAFDYFENNWSKENIGNYWSDYAGFDSNNDGIGDTPYDIPPDYGSNKDNHPIVDYNLIKKESNGTSGFSIAILVFSLIFILFLGKRRYIT